MANDVTEILARFAATLTYDAIPERVKECCKKLLLDALACALAGHRLEDLGSTRRLMDILRADR